MTMRMIPMVEISSPEMFASTAKYRIAPTAMRKSEVPMPTAAWVPATGARRNPPLPAGRAAPY